jgi:DNA invertase Pin-like site-specific DNA recombinase
MASAAQPLTALPPTVRAALVARVSSVEQDAEGKTSIAEQMARCRAEIERRAWTLDERHVFVDRVSGKLTSRFERPLAVAREGAIDALVFAKVDRLARSLRDLLNIEAELSELGVALVCTDQPIDTTTPTGRLMFQQLGAFAEYEASQIVERMTLANRASVRGGGWPGGELPWGLKLTGNKGDPNRQVELNPAEVATIRLAYDLVVNRGQSCWQAAETLNQAGKPPRHAQQWNNRLLRGALRSPTLKGEMFWSKPPSSARGRRATPGERNKTATGRYGGKIPVQIPAVLTEAEWAALQAALDRTSLARPIHADQVYLLSGRGGARIETPCGGRIHGFYRADRDLRQYRCINARTEAGPKRCRCPRIDAQDLESLVQMHVLGLAMNPDLLTEQARRWLNPEPATSPLEPAEDLDARIQRLERKRTNLALAAADLGPEAVVEAVGKVQAELDELVRTQEQARAQGNRQAQVEAAIPEILRYAQRLSEATFGNPDPHVWRRFLAQANVRVKIVRWLRPGEYSLMGDPYPYPYLASIEGELLAGDHATPGSTAG